MNLSTDVIHQGVEEPIPENEIVYAICRIHLRGVRNFLSSYQPERVNCSSCLILMARRSLRGRCVADGDLKG